MSILSAFSPLPLAVLAVIQTPAQKPEPVVAPVVAPAPVAKPVLAVAKPNQAQVIRVQQPAGPVMDRAAILDRAGRALTAVRTAKGKFTQTDSGGTETGDFYISRPGKIRFDYKTPESKIIISDGVTVSIEEPKRKSYDSAPLASTQFGLFLRANLDLTKDANVVGVASRSGAHFVTLEDKSGEAQGRIELEFGAEKFDLRGWTAVETNGSRTRVVLQGVEQNVSIPGSLFVVKAPEDNRR